jgi:adenylate cyclase
MGSSNVRIWLRSALCALVVTALLLAGGFEWLELRALETLYRVRGPRPPRTPIVIVTIDDDSFQELDLPWPWPRALHAQLLETLREAGPVAVGLDVLFVEPSPRGPADDVALGAAVARGGNVVLAAALTQVKDAAGTRDVLNAPLKVIRESAAGFGVVNLQIDPDAFVRGSQLTQPFQGDAMPSFDGELYRVAARSGLRAAPLPRSGGVVINYRGGPGTFPRVPYYRVLTGEVPPDTFKGRIVLVGATTPTLHDVFPTPYAPRGGMPGVEIHANILETLVQGTPLRRAPRALSAALVVAAGLLAGWLGHAYSPRLALGLVLATIAVHAGASVAAFVWLDAWMDQAAVPVVLVLGCGIAFVETLVQTRRERQRLTRFFSPAVLREVVHHSQELGRSRREITVLFSDIRGFTPMAEKLAPEEVAELLTEYMTSMTAAVFAHGGTVTHFAGDAIMALFNAPLAQPDHAVQAVRTGLEFQERIKTLSDRWAARCGAPLRNGVGINTGEAVVGIIGSAQRVEYGALGDTINLGSRLEGLTKEFATPIIISESTYQAVKGLVACRSLGVVSVKGKTIPVEIYAVEGTGQTRARQVVLDSPLTITDTEAEFSLSVQASIQDLSLTGLRAHEVPRRLLADRVVELSFEVPGLARAVTTGARVMWSRDDQAGFQFLHLAPDDATAIADFLRRDA